MKIYNKDYLSKFLNTVKSYLTSEKSLLVMSLSILIIINSFLSYSAIIFQQKKAYSLEMGEDTAIFLQKVWNSINGRLFVSAEKFGCGSHHWDITIVLLFGPLLKIFQNPFIIIHSTVLLFWTSLIIFFIFYFSLNYKKHRVLVGLLASLAYLLNETIVNRGFATNYSSSILFAPLFTLSILLFIKRKYKLAGLLMILSYMVNLETIPYLTLLFFVTILILFRKYIPEYEKKTFYGLILLTIGYIVIFHFILYGYLTFYPGENVFSYYYKTRHETSVGGNPIITLINNLLDLSNDKIVYILKNLLFVPPFSFNPSTLFTILMSLSSNKEFVNYYIFPDSHYNIPNPIFTLLFLWSFLYYKKPKKIVFVYLILLITLIFELSYIDELYNFFTYNTSPVYPIIEEIDYVIKNYIKYNESITTYPTLSFLFYKNSLVLYTPSNIVSCKLAMRYCEKDRKLIWTTYYLLLKKDDTNVYISSSETCRKDILEKNLEEQGYEKIYEGKYLILFKIKNESLAYYGTPFLDLTKILGSKNI